MPPTAVHVILVLVLVYPATLNAAGTISDTPSKCTKELDSPDAAAVIARSASLSPVELNTEITRGYKKFATELQCVVGAGVSSGTYPVWFYFAPHASAEVGGGQVACDAVLDLLKLCTTPGCYTNAVIGQVMSTDWSSAMKFLVTGLLRVPPFAVSYVPGGPVAQAAMAFATNMYIALSKGTGAGNVDAVTLRLLPTFGMRAYNLIKPGGLAMLLLPGGVPITAANVILRVKQLAEEMRDLLKHGNRAIYNDIGGSAQQYIRWRNAQPSRSVSARKVVEGFTLPGSQVDKIKLAYDYVAQRADEPEIDFYKTGLSGLADPTNSASLAVAAFAIWERAGSLDPDSAGSSGGYASVVGSELADAAKRLETEVDEGRGMVTRLVHTFTGGSPAKRRKQVVELLRNRLVSWGNNMLAYREQAIAVDPTFQMNLPLFEFTTPLTQLGVGPSRDKWTFAEYCDRKGVDISTQNWGNFEHRWPPIIDAFEAGYKALDTIGDFPSDSPHQADNPRLDCYKHDDRNWIKAPGTCQRTTTLGCGADGECRKHPDKDKACTSTCVCARSGFNRCMCVSNVPGGFRCTDKGNL